MGWAFGQDFPSKPITVVVGYPPGGDTDAMARLFSEKLAARLKQPVIIDNKPGAGTTIANNLVGRAAADGYTLLFTPNSFTIAQLVMKIPASAGYDVLDPRTAKQHVHFGWYEVRLRRQGEGWQMARKKVHLQNDLAPGERPAVPS
ncbi:MAG: hypothetical protein ABT20_11500 [Rubrivivax sp. SCN 70-15]|nr:MAG: hypothetical protein ABT20_11500 [Rubrivivax sp. SCN 70-15]